MATFCNWRKRYGGDALEMKGPRRLEAENAKPRTLLVDLGPDRAMLQDVPAKKL